MYAVETKSSRKLFTLVCLINEHVRLFFLEKKSTLCALIRQYSIIMIRPCAFINFLIFFHPVRLLSPVRLLGRLEYKLYYIVELDAAGLG